MPLAPFITPGTLTPRDGFIVEGVYNLSAAGDINGDGINDLIAEARWEDSSGRDAGGAIVIYGRAGTDRGRLDASTLTSDYGYLIEVEGQTRHYDYGFSVTHFLADVSGAGDLNGDGIEDLIVGTTWGGGSGLSSDGAYVIYGSAGTTRGNVDLDAFSISDGYALQGDRTRETLDVIVASVGDVNGDGIDDVVIGAADTATTDGYTHFYYGKFYVVYGQAGATHGPVDLGQLTPSQGFSTYTLGITDHEALTVSPAGDINGDGLADVIFGTESNFFGDDFGSRSYVVYGQTGTTRSRIDFRHLSNTDGFIIQHSLDNDYSKFRVSSAGDVNGDGIDDLIIGARRAAYPNANAGEAYVVYGTAGRTRGLLDLGALSPDEGFIIRGDAAGDFAAWSVSSAGDINGDGVTDLIVGAPLGDDNGVDAGEAYVIYGLAGTLRGNISLTGLLASDGFVIRGDAARDRLGISVSGAGDVNGDGIDDLIVNASGAGDAYVIYGRADTVQSSVSLNLDSTAALRSIAHLTLNGTRDIDGSGNSLGNRLTGNAGANSLKGWRGDDTLNGGLGDDTMLGGSGDDTYVVDSIADRVFETTTETSPTNAGGSDTVYSFISFNLGTTTSLRFVEHLTLAGTGNLNGSGNALANRLTGNAGANLLQGWRGSDTLDAGLGNDTMLGGAGNDTYYVNAIGDRVFETTTLTSQIDAGGIDTVHSAVTLNLDATAGLRFVENLTLNGSGALNASGNALNNRLTGSIGVNVLTGWRGNDTLDGGASGFDTMIGGAGNDTYIVFARNDKVFETTTATSVVDAGGFDTVRSAVNFNLNADAGVRFVEALVLTGSGDTNGNGNALANRLTGNAGDNVLNGRYGNDTMSGGAGDDVFVFDTALSVRNIDYISDFNVVEDTIHLHNAVFSGLAAGTLARSAFVANLTGRATDALDRIIYETDTGRLFFDADGNGAGSSIHFATLKANLAVTNADFILF